MKTETTVSLSNEEITQAVKNYIAANMFSVEPSEITSVFFWEDKQAGTIRAEANMREVEICL